MLKYAFKDYSGVMTFEFRATGGLFYHQRFKAKNLTRNKILTDFKDTENQFSSVAKI